MSIVIVVNLCVYDEPLRRMSYLMIFKIIYQDQDTDQASS